MMTMGDGETSSEMLQITVDSSEMLRGRKSSNLNYTDSEARHTAWTDEKHSLYLKSMEASFVNELHYSMGLLRGQAQKKAMEKDSLQQHTSRDGFWKNISVNKYGSKLEATSESRALMGNSWIRHFRHTAKHQMVEAGLSQDIDDNADRIIKFEKKATLGFDNNMKQSTTTLSRQDSDGSNTEMSDQNFVDNDESMKSCSVRRAKRKKTKANNSADNDHVVPKDPISASDRKRLALKRQC